MRALLRLTPVLLFLVAASPGCDDEEISPGPVSQPKQVPSAQVRAAVAFPSSSAPWEAEQYSRQGMPSTDKAWGVDEYKAASKLILEIAAKAPEQIPRLGGTSEAIFQKYTSVDHLRAIEKGQAGAEGIKSLAGIMEHVWPVLNLYVLVAKLPKGPSREFFAISMFSLDLVNTAFSLGDTLIPNMDPKDPSYAGMMTGVEQTRFGAIQMLSAAVTVLSDVTWAVEDRVFLAERLSRVMPSLLGRFSDQTSTGLIRRVETMALAERQPELRKALEGLSLRIKASAPKNSGASAVAKPKKP